MEQITADPVAARLATHVVAMHAGLVAWIAAAEYARTLGHVDLDASVSQSRDPDDRMLTLVEERLDNGAAYDPEHLEPTRHYLADRIGRFGEWYVEQTGTMPHMARWGPLAIKLEDIIGDQVAAHYLATCLLSHHHVAITALNRSRGRCQAARERWRRLAVRYVRVLDEQPSKGRIDAGGRVMVESVGEDEMRRFG